MRERLPVVRARAFFPHSLRSQSCSRSHVIERGLGDSVDKYLFTPSALLSQRAYISRCFRDAYKGYSQLFDARNRFL